MENNKESLPVKPGLAEEKSAADADQQNFWCFSYWADSPHAEYNEKAALLKNSKWNPGDTISVSFLDGDPEVQERVKKAAMNWVKPGLANLTFDFRKNTNDTDIRISFRYAGSWSVLGTTCKKITDKTQPTMNYGWLNKNSTDDEVKRVVLHEFGHALGLIHEHLSPEGGVKWNRKQVIKDLSGPPNNWSESVIENNMFRTFTKEQLNLTRLDRNSIMMYPIPAKWTQDGFTVGLNTDLSDVDKQFIKAQYP
jgi:serralysin